MKTMNHMLLASAIFLAALADTRAQTTFTKITSGEIVTDVGLSAGCSWGDYNNDGYLDMFVANSLQGANNFLYRNNGDGTFTKVSSGSIVTDGGNSIGCVWGDFDNDGLLDLFVANGGRQTSLPSLLYHNNGNGDFTRITNAVTEPKFSYNGVWGDYDNDGYVDLFLADNGGKKNALYHNNGGSSFMKITAGSPVNEGGNSIACAWGDFNNDGYLDLFVANLTKNFLYTNQQLDQIQARRHSFKSRRYRSQGPGQGDNWRQNSLAVTGDFQRVRLFRPKYSRAFRARRRHEY